MFESYNYDFNHDEDKPKKINYIKTRDIFKISDKKIYNDLKKIDDDKKKDVIKLEKEGIQKKHFEYKKSVPVREVKKEESKKESKKDDSIVQRAIKIRMKQNYY